jgi:two-component system nitrogen regulation response regulator GlnG
VKLGAFRAPLLHRLASYTVVVPPLRARRDDIGRLIRHFVRAELGIKTDTDQEAIPSAMPPSVVAALCRYDWPGNVRQLRNAVRQLVVGSRGGGAFEPGPALTRILSASLGGTSSSSSPPAQRLTPVYDRAERRRPAEVAEEELLEALRASRWDLKATAERLRISRTSLYAVIEASPKVRKVSDIDADEIARCHAECGGDLERMVEKLEVSKHALQRRLRELRLR